MHFSPATQRLSNLVLSDLPEDVVLESENVMVIPMPKDDFRASGSQTCPFGVFSPAKNLAQVKRRQIFDLVCDVMGGMPVGGGNQGGGCFGTLVSASYYLATSNAIYILVVFESPIAESMAHARLNAAVVKAATRVGRLPSTESTEQQGKGSKKFSKAQSKEEREKAARARRARNLLRSLSGADAELVPLEHLSQDGYNDNSSNWDDTLGGWDELAGSLLAMLEGLGVDARLDHKPPVFQGNGDEDGEPSNLPLVQPEFNKIYGHDLALTSDFHGGILDPTAAKIPLTLEAVLNAHNWFHKPVLDGAGLRDKVTVETGGSAGGSAGLRFGLPRDSWKSFRPEQLTELRSHLIPGPYKYFARYCAFNAATPHPDAVNRESDIARLKRFYATASVDLTNAPSAAARAEIRSDMVASVWMLLQTSEDLPETFIKARKLLQDLNTTEQTMHTPNGGKGYLLNKYWNLTASQNTYLCFLKMCETELDIYTFHHFAIKALLCYLTINERADRCIRIHAMNGGPGGVGKSFVMEKSAGHFFGFAVRVVDYSSQQVTFVNKPFTDMYDYQLQITDEAPEELVNGPGCRDGKSSFETTSASKLKTERSSASMQNRVLSLNKTTGMRDMLQLSTTVDNTVYTENSNAHLNNMNPALKSRYMINYFHATKRLTERPSNDVVTQDDSPSMQMFTYKLYFLTLLQSLKILPTPNLSGISFFLNRFRKVVASSVMFDDTPGNIFTPRFSDQVRSLVCNIVNLNALAQVFLDEDGVHTRAAFFDPVMLVDTVPFVRPTEHDYVMAVSCLEHKLFHPYTRHIGECLVEHYFGGNPEPAFEERASRFDAVIRDGDESPSDMEFRRDYVFVTDFAGKRDTHEAIVELANVLKYRTESGKAFNVDQGHYESNLVKMSGITQKLRFCFANHSVYVFASRAYLMEIMKKEETFLNVLKRTVEACPHSPAGRYITMDPLLLNSMKSRMAEFRGTSFEHLYYTVVKERLVGHSDLSVPYLSSYFDVLPCGILPLDKPAHGLWLPEETFWPRGPCTRPGCWRCALRGTPADMYVVDQTAYPCAADKVIELKTKEANEAVSLPAPHKTIFFKPASLENDAAVTSLRLFSYPGHDLETEAQGLTSLEGLNRDDALLRKHSADKAVEATRVKRARTFCALL